MTLKKFENSTKRLKFAEKTNTLNAYLFNIYLNILKLTLGHCQLLPPERGQEKPENYIFPLKMIFPYKIFLVPF